MDSRHFVRHFHDHITSTNTTGVAQHCTNSFQCLRSLSIEIMSFWTILWAFEPHRGVGVCFQGTVLSAGPSSMNIVPPAPQNGAQMGPNDSIGRYSKVPTDFI